ncbi:MAG: hybrid sensor histidine kinase/response regulator [Herminiimonas sp.]|nr:hybrid sensor histidine kinase/response regulator [Herminiimonas sp.]
MTTEGNSKGHHFPTSGDSEAAAIFDLETQQLQHRISGLSNEVMALREASKDKEKLAELVSQLREANQNLVMATVQAQATRDEAEIANRRQNEFLAMLAHELRNPLASIGMAAILLEKIAAAHADLPKLHTIIHRQTEHMARLLDDLLDAARINSGKIALTMEPVSLSEILERALETSRPFVNARKQQLTVDVPNEPLVIEGDRVRLAQVFSNLLVNASKFTQDQGLITLSVEKQPGNAVITVRDNGMGIAPDVLPYIFEMFTQGPRSLARSEGGLGIGLTVVRSMVKMHGGSVEARSAGPNCGSAFIVVLPLCAEQRNKVLAPQREQTRSCQCRILLVEDNADANQTLEQFLTLEGHSVCCAFDGPSGLAMATEDRFDVIICDVGLPGMDGLALIRELRRQPMQAMPFTIAVTGYGQSEDRIRAIEAGFDHYLVKPVDGDALLSLISSRAPT